MTLVYGGNGRGAAGDAELAVDVFQVLVHCSRAAAEAAPYCCIGQAACHEAEHLLLPGGEICRARPGAPFARGQPVSRVGVQPRHSAGQPRSELSEKVDCLGRKVRTGSVRGDTDVQADTRREGRREHLVDVDFLRHVGVHAAVAEISHALQIRTADRPAVAAGTSVTGQREAWRALLEGCRCLMVEQRLGVSDDPAGQ